MSATRTPLGARVFWLIVLAAGLVVVVCGSAGVHDLLAAGVVPASRVVRVSPHRHARHVRHRWIAWVGDRVDTVVKRGRLWWRDVDLADVLGAALYVSAAVILVVAVLAGGVG